ncbi:MAG: GyrI-like domain-containing protein [Gemmatimonadota bacterium]|nr:MAG: GyrI-like domain-containing protein [Gemmatimonadota bacterium]
MSEHSQTQPERVEVQPVLALQIASESRADPQEISKAMEQAFCELRLASEAHTVQSAGPPRAIYTAYSPDAVKFTVVMPIASEVSGGIGDGPVMVGEVPGGKALRFVHKGPYPKLMETYGKITEWMKANDMLESEADWAKYVPMWEEYVNDPESTPAEELITQIYVPLP